VDGWTGKALSIIPDDARHDRAVEALMDAAFGPGRFAKTAERVRETSSPWRSGSRLALSADRLVGACRLWPVTAGARALFLGPIAVDRSWRSGGLGRQLVAACEDAAAAAGEAAIILIGERSFFGPQGYEPVPAERITLPGPGVGARLMWKAIRPDGLDALSGPLTGLHEPS
jgi:predicted N-acetyltransferase YhbS